MTKKILVIDDESDIREVAKLCLEINSNWEVITADSGESGVAAATTEQPDAILLDVMMPDMDGLATLTRLQNDGNTQDIPVILLTAKVQATQEYRYQNLRIAAVLAKPFDPVNLAAQIAQILNWKL
ncbi:MAG TPA: response regulator [Oscillatoriales cyanobacterium M59_W2019_021]|nr:response regulator [Oscillatoriales cyanobacterium M4454_W2019_049]HIK52137.1 response regulator [Oscillatoriales cyanobacterium M59_W2019_021]